MKKTHGSLFSGIGAPELASEWIGWKKSISLRNK